MARSNLNLELEANSEDIFYRNFIHSFFTLLVLEDTWEHEQLFDYRLHDFFQGKFPELLSSPTDPSTSRKRS